MIKCSAEGEKNADHYRRHHHFTELEKLVNECFPWSRLWFSSLLLLLPMETCPRTSRTLPVFPSRRRRIQLRVCHCSSLLPRAVSLLLLYSCAMCHSFSSPHTSSTSIEDERFQIGLSELAMQGCLGNDCSNRSLTSPSHLPGEEEEEREARSSTRRSTLSVD